MRRIAIAVLLLVVAAALVAAGVLFVRRGGSVRADTSMPKVAEDLAVLAQSLDAPISGMGNAWLPDSALALHPLTAEVGPDGANLSCGREGPEYTLSREGEPWVLFVTRNSRGPRPIASATIPRDRKISMPDFVAHTMKVYASRLASEPNDRFHHLNRLEFGLRFLDRPAVRPLLADSIQRAPDLSEPRIALAMFDESGMRDLEQWAAAKDSFRKVTDVALAHWFLHHTDSAISAMQRALKLPIREESHQNLNACARAMPIVEMALAERRYDAAIEIATHMHDAPDVDAYSRKVFEIDWRALRAAATYRKGDHAGAVALVTDGLVPADPFYQRPDDARPKLAAAIRAGDDAAVEAWKPDAGTDIGEAFFGRSDLLKKLGLDAR